MKKYIIMILILLTISGLSAYDDAYIVNQNGPGDYTNIMSAVNAVQTSAIIYVVGTVSDYTGVNNTNISWNGNSKTIHIKGLNDPVIDCNDQSRAFNLSYTTDDVIEGLTIENASYSSNAGGAIRVKDGSIKIKDNTFIDCHNGEYSVTYEMNEWSSIYLRGGAIFIEQANSNQSSEITGNSFENCVSFEGGAVCCETGNFLISDNIFNNNHSGWYENPPGTVDGGNGGALFSLTTYDYITIEDNTFSNNTTARLGAAIHGCGDIRNNLFISNNVVGYVGMVEPNVIGHLGYVGEELYLNNNVFKNNFTNFGLMASLFYEADECINNTFLSNDSYVSQTSTSFTNCIFEENDQIIDSSILTNCCINNNGSLGNLTLINCIEVDPELNSTTYQPLWNSSVKSPCIDAGDPTVSNDDDDTPSDIGAIRAVTHKYDIVELPSPEEDNGWKWLSFPALDNVLDDADVAENVLGDVLDIAILDTLFSQYYDIYWDEDEWLHDDEQFSRTEGFKFLMLDDITFDVPGFKEADNTTIVLAGNSAENWVGYWLEETQHVSDAFGDYWDEHNINFIQHQKWTAFYLGRWRIMLYGCEEPTLSYGDMVVVKCNTTINNFQWDTGLPIEKTLIADTEYFTFEEQADYIPLFIELDSSNMPEEIGAFVNGECIGARVVEDTLAQINAYTTSAPPGNIELELYYGGRSENKRLTSYNCVSSSNPNIVLTQLSTENIDDAWFVDLREGSSMVPTPEKVSLNNYPNPFNPTTTIAYSLPNDGMIELRVFNIKGQLVKTLVDGKQLAGSYEMVWNGKDNNEKNVSSGIYFYKLSTKDDTIMKKMLMLK